MGDHWLLIVAIFSYLIGSFPTAKIVSRKNSDEWGRDSWGTMSTLQKTGSKLKGAIVLAGDILKGFLPVFISTAFALPGGYGETNALFLSSTGVILGHNYSIFLRFRGGRGLATGFGVMLAVNWMLALACLVTLLLAIFLVEFWMRGSFKGGFLKLARENLLGRLIGIILCLAVVYWFVGVWRFCALFLMMVLIIVSHRERVTIFVSENKATILKRLGFKLEE